ELLYYTWLIMGNALICLQPPEANEPPRRVIIDKAMIGLPSNFRHVAHGGADEDTSSQDINPIAEVMSSKGGYMDNIKVEHDITLNAMPVLNPMVQVC
ncbi:hypothetical protein, partial [Salmonella sp. s51228]|uniref:hypothetical protein n=1 Tax=Salmonella sp. s51228 TaxID=3159652 RepID=UPI00397F34F8